MVPQDPLLIAGTVQQTLAESWDGVKMLDPRRVCFCFTIDLFTHTHTLTFWLKALSFHTHVLHILQYKEKELKRTVFSV